MSAYVDALRLLARRDLSETQVRQRLTRRGYSDEDIEAAVVKLKADRAIDDARVAEAIARSESGLKRRGRLRIKRKIESTGVSAAIARQAIETVFADVDDGALLEAALQKRLRGRTHAADDREFQRLYRYLIGQGFEADRVAAALRSRRPKRAGNAVPQD